MGIEAMVISKVVGAIGQARAASADAKANIDQDLSAEKSRALQATIEFNDMLGANRVLGATSGIDLSSASFMTMTKKSEMNFRLNRAQDRISTGNIVRAHKRKKKQIQSKAMFSAATSIVGGYTDTVKAAGGSGAGGGLGSYFGIKVGG